MNKSDIFEILNNAPLKEVARFCANHNCSVVIEDKRITALKAEKPEDNESLATKVLKELAGFAAGFAIMFTLGITWLLEWW